MFPFWEELHVVPDRSLERSLVLANRGTQSCVRRFAVKSFQPNEETVFENNAPADEEPSLLGFLDISKCLQ
jgi:hypothetical protein